MMRILRLHTYCCIVTVLQFCTDGEENKSSAKAESHGPMGLHIVSSVEKSGQGGVGQGLGGGWGGGQELGG